MSLIDSTVKQIYVGNKAWFDNIVEYINMRLTSLSNKPDRDSIYLLQDYGLSHVDMSRAHIEQTFIMLQTVFTPLGIIVTKADVNFGIKTYPAILIDCKILLKDGKFDKLSLNELIPNPPKVARLLEIPR